MSGNTAIKRKIRVVLIDSGIDITKNDLSLCVMERIGFKINHEGKIDKIINPVVKNEHGTLIASCIKYICKDIELIDINILTQNLTCDGRVFLHALKYSLMLSPDIVHLSLGTTKFKYYFSLKKIIKKLQKNNVIIVAAANNYEEKSYPAYFKNVIGVKGEDTNDFNRVIFKDKFYYAPYRLPKDLCTSDEHYSIFGNSIACAYLTGHICKHIKDIHSSSINIKGMQKKPKSILLGEEKDEYRRN